VDGQAQPATRAASGPARTDAAGWSYAPSLTLREARAQYFLRAGFDERSYSDRWVRLAVFGRPLLAFPNTAGRVRAVKLHDLHHVLTGYDTSWAGEAEIGAWELASGCRDHWAAWALNAAAALIGLCVAPRRVRRAFARGRREHNLYDVEISEGLLGESVGAVRARLGLEAS
jgi:hypothetical protein